MKEKIIYSGIDWLSIGLFVETKEPEKWENLINDYKTKIGNIIKRNPYKFQIMTSKNLAKTRYSIMLIEEKFNITFKITRPPKKNKIELVKNGFVRMPDILVEIPAKALRPQNIAYTENAVKEVLNIFNARPYAFIYSRIDYNTDLYNPTKEELEKILNSFKNSIKRSEAGTEEYSDLYIGKEPYNFRRGTKGYKEISEYRTLKRDNELKEIYREKLNKEITKKELKKTWRIELRINRKYLRVHRNFEISKIHKTRYINLIQMIDQAYKIFKEDKTLNNEIIKELYLKSEKPQIIGFYKEFEKIDIKQAEVNTEEIYKIILGLFNKAYQELKGIYEIINPEDVFNHFFKSLKKDLKEYIEEKAEKEEPQKDYTFFKLLKESINYIKDTAEGILKESRFILEEIKEDFNYKYEKPKAKVKNLLENLKVKGVSPKTQRQILFDEQELNIYGIDF